MPCPPNHATHPLLLDLPPRDFHGRIPSALDYLKYIADAVQRFFVADDVFKVIALPDRCSRRLAQFINISADNGFE
jgi:hypothetical protein